MIEIAKGRAGAGEEACDPAALTWKQTLNPYRLSWFASRGDRIAYITPSHGELWVGGECQLRIARGGRPADQMKRQLARYLAPRACA